MFSRTTSVTTVIMRQQREAVPHVVLDRLGMERLERLESEAGQAARRDPVLDMDAGDPARLQHAEQLRREVVHLLPEVAVVFVCPKSLYDGLILVLGC